MHVWVHNFNKLMKKISIYSEDRCCFPDYENVQKLLRRSELEKQFLKTLDVENSRYKEITLI